MRLGVDIGGTFTDLVLADAGGELERWKVPSTPPEFSEGVWDGIQTIASARGTTTRDLLGSLDAFVHGTTVTTNIVLTRTGDRVGVLTTRGFGELYEVARQYRGREQDPAEVRHPVPLVPRGQIEEIGERMDYLGQAVVPLDTDGVRRSVRRLLSEGIRSFAICFLWSFRNSQHEELAKRIVLEEDPDAFVAASYEACPLIGEYERLSTTVITAYAGPALRRYAARLDDELRDGGLRSRLLLMKSDGGLGSVDAAVRAAGSTIYSGPVAGVMGACPLGEELGESHLITFDMGGTSTDVGLVHDGEVRRTALQFLDRQALATPMVDVTTVGAGGGSIGWVGPGRTLRVGPQSAGALPGAACYGRGGDDATVTDANLVLGLLDPDSFLGGDMRLDAAAAQSALARLADQLGLSALEAAAGMFRVANSVMANAIRLRTVFAGLDPRTFTLVSFGGAGGLHAASVADELDIRRVVVPRQASVYSAAGLISTDVVSTFARSTHKHAGAERTMEPRDLAELNATFAQLDAQVHAALDVHDLAPAQRVVVHELDISYFRQVLDFPVEVPQRVLTQDDLNTALGSFEQRYAEIYGVGAAAPETGYDVKAFRVRGIGKVGEAVAVADGRVAPPAVAPVATASSTRPALARADAGRLEDVAVFAAAGLPPGATVEGPAIVEYDDTSVLVPSGWSAAVDAAYNLRMEVS